MLLHGVDHAAVPVAAVVCVVAVVVILWLPRWVLARGRTTSFESLSAWHWACFNNRQHRQHSQRSIIQLAKDFYCSLFIPNENERVGQAVAVVVSASNGLAIVVAR